jgi:hypothetical protein
MKSSFSYLSKASSLLILSLTLAGCASISEHSHAYLGSPTYAQTDPASIQILPGEPSQPKERLGEIFLSVEGSPPRTELEQKLKQEASKLGADAVFIVSDRTHIFPVAYYGGWWGPVGVAEEYRRGILAVAIKYKQPLRPETNPNKTPTT